MLAVVFWACVICVAYPYAFYPLLLSLRLRLAGGPELPGPPPEGWAAPPVSLVLAAHNEEAVLGRRLDELVAQVAAWGPGGEVIVVSDGSTDHTVDVARAYEGRGVRLVELPCNQGKAAALAEGWAAAHYEVLVFADSRQIWADDALPRLLGNFAEPTIGGVSGDLVLRSPTGTLAGVGLYWRFEKWLRKTESRAHSTVGVTGAICAVRRGLFRPPPAGTILDDVYWPLRVVMQHSRVIHDERARAYDQLPDRARDEFHRKVRTLAGNFQLFTLLPSAFLPWRNPVWWQFLSHKVARLLVPWALLGALASSAALPGAYRAAFCAQVVCYAVAVAGLQTWAAERSRVASTAASFLTLNAAAWVAFWVWVSGQSARSWGKISYKTTSPTGSQWKT